MPLEEPEGDFLEVQGACEEEAGNPGAEDDDWE